MRDIAIAKIPGGKRQLLPQILPILPAKIGTYYEPFVGGGAVFFALAQEKRFERAVINDRNADIVAAYTAVRDKLPELLQKLEGHALQHAARKPEYYYEVRAQQPDVANVVETAARFLYMGRVGFNGLIRYNKSGQWNVPIGDYENPEIVNSKLFREINILLRAGNVKIRSAGDFQLVALDAKKGDVWYADPPYVPLSKTSNFVGYQGEGFNEEDQKRLRDLALDLKKRGVFVLLSNSSADLVRDLYKAPDFVVREVDARRAVNSKSEKRGNVKELLIT